MGSEIGPYKDEYKFSEPKIPERRIDLDILSDGSPSEAMDELGNKLTPDFLKPAEALDPAASTLKTITPGQSKDAEGVALEAADLSIPDPELKAKSNKAWGDSGAKLLEPGEKFKLGGGKFPEGYDEGIVVANHVTTTDFKGAGDAEALAKQLTDFNGTDSSFTDFLNTSLAHAQKNDGSKLSDHEINAATNRNAGSEHGAVGALMSDDAKGIDLQDDGDKGKYFRLGYDGEGGDRQYAKVYLNDLAKAGVSTESIVPIVADTQAKNEKNADEDIGIIKVSTSDDLAKLKDAITEKFKSLSDSAMRNAESISGIASFAGPNAKALIGAGLLALSNAKVPNSGLVANSKDSEASIVDDIQFTVANRLNDISDDSTNRESVEARYALDGLREIEKFANLNESIYKAGKDEYFYDSFNNKLYLFQKSVYESDPADPNKFFNKIDISEIVESSEQSTLENRKMKALMNSFQDFMKN